MKFWLNCPQVAQLHTFKVRDDLLSTGNPVKRGINFAIRPIGTRCVDDPLSNSPWAVKILDCLAREPGAIIIILGG